MTASSRIMDSVHKWPPQSTHLNPVEHLWDVVEPEVGIMVESKRLGVTEEGVEKKSLRDSHQNSSPTN